MSVVKLTGRGDGNEMSQGAESSSGVPLPSASSDQYHGPNEIGWARWPGRGTTYYGCFHGHNVQVYITEKREMVRIFVDGEEYKP